MPNQSTTREAKAQQLIDSGAVVLHVGQGYATIKGSGNVSYTVTKTSCGCKDFTQRGVEWYKHRLAAKTLCAEYRRLKAAAQCGLRVRPSTALLQAIRWPEKPKAEACRDCGRPLNPIVGAQYDLCADCFLLGTAA